LAFSSTRRLMRRSARGCVAPFSRHCMFDISFFSFVWSQITFVLLYHAHTLTRSKRARSTCTRSPRASSSTSCG
jgi:hypothetical protein